MESLKEDIATINQKALCVALDESLLAKNKRILNFDNRVRNLIKECTSEGCKIAINCSIPLIEFQENIFDVIINFRGNLGKEAPDSELVELNTQGLLIAQKCALARELSAKIWFGLNNKQLEILKNSSYSNLIRVASLYANIFQLRNGYDPVFWDQILIGRKITGERGALISCERALLSLTGKGRGTQWA